MPQIFHSLFDVCLRNWESNDLPRYAELVGDPRVMKFIGDGATRDAATATREIRRFRQEIDQRGWSRWAVSLGESGPFLGYAGFSEKPDGIDFGLRFLYQYWGSPYPFMSACLAVEYGFDKLGFEKVYCMNDVRHALAVKLTNRVAHIAPIQVATPQGPYNRYDLTKQHYDDNEIRSLNRNEMGRFANRLKKQQSRVTLPKVNAAAG